MMGGWQGVAREGDGCRAISWAGGSGPHTLFGGSGPHTLFALCECACVLSLYPQDECRAWDINEVVFSPDLWRMYQPMLRADFRIFDEYEIDAAGGRAHSRTDGYPPVGAPPSAPPPTDETGEVSEMISVWGAPAEKVSSLLGDAAGVPSTIAAGVAAPTAAGVPSAIAAGVAETTAAGVPSTTAAGPVVQRAVQAGGVASTSAEPAAAASVEQHAASASSTFSDAATAAATAAAADEEEEEEDLPTVDGARQFDFPLHCFWGRSDRRVSKGMVEVCVAGGLGDDCLGPRLIDPGDRDK